MNKSIMLLLALALALAVLFLPFTSPADTSMDLFYSLRALESDFQKYLNGAKEEVRQSFEDQETQAFNRSGMRKKFSFARKSDFNDSPIRVSIYEARSKNGEDYAHPLFESYKPAVIWDKILPALMSEALRLTGEGKAQKEDGFSKFTEMASLLMPNAKKIGFRTPGEFIDLKLMGEDTLFYWNYVTKRCPQRVRNALGIDSCLKGLYLAEIDKRVLLRNYWNTLKPKEGARVFMAFLDQAQEKEYVFQLLPSEEGSNKFVFDSIQKALKESLPYINTQGPNYYGAVRFPGVLDAIVGIIGHSKATNWIISRDKLLIIILVISLILASSMAWSNR